MSTIDQQFVEYIVKTLVNEPEKVSVERQIDEKGVLLKLSVDPEDIGRVIGRRGATAQSIRTLLRALGTKNDARYNLKIVDTDGGEGAPRRDYDDAPVVDEVSEEVSDKSEESEAVEESAEEEAGSDSTELAEKTRAELAEYDDLDI